MAKIPSQNKVPRELSTCFRVLAIDEDHNVLDFIKQMCHQFQYLVITWDKSPPAWSFVREREHLIDVILMEVHMPQMDGFEFLQRASREINVPIIMMSVDSAKSTVKEAIELGACDYWIKPLHADLFKEIRKHVVQKDLRRKKNSELSLCSSSISRDQDSVSANEAEEVGESEHGSAVTKKPRMIWSEAQHQEFVKVVQQIGIDVARPKRVHDMMSKSFPGLTRNNVTSHFQTYKKHLKTISEGGAQQQKEMPLPITVVGTTESRAGSSGRLNFRDLTSSSNHPPYETEAVTPHLSLTGNLTPNEEQLAPNIQLSTPIPQLWTESDAQAIENQGIIQRNNEPRMNTKQQQMQQQRHPQMQQQRHPQMQQQMQLQRQQQRHPQMQLQRHPHLRMPLQLPLQQQLQQQRHPQMQQQMQPQMQQQMQPQRQQQRHPQRQQQMQQSRVQQTMHVTLEYSSVVPQMQQQMQPQSQQQMQPQRQQQMQPQRQQQMQPQRQQQRHPQRQQQMQQSRVPQTMHVTLEYSSVLPASVSDRLLMHQYYTPARPHQQWRPLPASESHRPVMHTPTRPAELEIRSPASNFRNQNISTDIDSNTTKKRPNSI